MSICNIILWFISSSIRAVKVGLNLKNSFNSFELDQPDLIKKKKEATISHIQSKPKLTRIRNNSNPN